MFPSQETCKRWSQKRKFIRQPFRMVAGMVICFVVTLISLFDGQMAAAKLFGALGGFFFTIYAVANWIVWRAGEASEERRP
ncbi:MAG: hypothetical protein CMM47_07245 [Rhodospirillaceae bacterium]|nr:hypothetical protein [Rhodospirillaceae bacterium]